ncbi:MAG: adenosylcobinamide-GDP ribazoletransferase [Lachnospiraceae bacterium]|nr:adenosylcobinamide-GDP ribazoletransferase [Lachnospiraceae bacterium]
MKQIWNSFRLALAMYSIIPARQVEKNRANMKYILVFVPLIGALIGFLIKEWMIISPYLINKDLMGAVVCAILPIFLSGGAFLDGFFRTVDALASHQTREEKLEILRDSHSGYFSLTICIGYFFIIVGLWSEMPLDSWPVLGYGFVLSRALYGLSIVCFKHAQKSKCSFYVTKGVSKAVVTGILIAYIAVCVAGMLLIDAEVALCCLAGAALAFAYYCYVAFHHFGGITEDIAAFFVHVCEIMMPLVVLAVNILTSLDLAG